MRNIHVEDVALMAFFIGTAVLMCSIGISLVILSATEGCPK